MATIQNNAYARGNDLEGKVALITGASRNIGRATALALAAGGARIAVNTRASRDLAEGVVKDIRAAGGEAEVFMADIADGAQVKSAVEGALKRFGRIDILVLNASVRTEVPFLEMSYETWREPLGITLDGAFFLAQACLPSMLANGGGSIVTLGGMHSLSGAKKRLHGSVAKHGLVGFTRSIAREFGDRGVRANCVAPGSINTVRVNQRSERPAPTTVPMLRYGEAEEIAGAIRFLAGPGSSYVNGQTLHVNGGELMT